MADTTQPRADAMQPDGIAPRAKPLTQDDAGQSARTGGGVYDSMALMRSLRTDPTPSVSDLGAASEPPTAAPTWTEAVAALKQDVADLDTLRDAVVRKVLVIAERVGGLQRWHAEQRKRNPESVPAAFVQSLAEALDRSTSHVEQWLTISKMDGSRKALIAAHPRIDQDFTAVLAVARAADPAKATALVLAYQDDGRAGFNAVRDPLAARAKTDPGFRQLVKNLHDPSNILGGIGAATPLPTDLVAQYDELKVYATFGEAREATKGLLDARGHTRARVTPKASPGTPRLRSPGQPAADRRPGLRTLTLRRDGTPTEIPGLGRVRVVDVTAEHVVVEVHDAPDPSADPPGGASLNGSSSMVCPAEPETQASAEDCAKTGALDRAGASEGETRVVEFSASADDIRRAVSTVAAFVPPAVRTDGFNGGLIVAAGSKAYFQARDCLRYVRAGIPARVAVAGAFVLPWENMKTLTHTSGTVAFRACSVLALDEHRVTISTTGGATAELQTCDPRVLSALDRHLASATERHTYNAALLREALVMSLPFVSPARRNAPHLSVLQVHGRSSGGGTVYATNGKASSYFASSALSGGGFTVHRDHLRLLTRFLRSRGTVDMRSDQNRCFLIAGDDLFGWNRAEAALPIYAAPAENHQTVVLASKRDALKRIAFVRAARDKKTTWCRVSYDGSRRELRVGGVDGAGAYRSLPVPVEVRRGGDLDHEFEVDIDGLKALFGSARSKTPELRIAPDELSTQETLSLDGHACTVTRTTPTWTVVGFPMPRFGSSSASG